MDILISGASGLIGSSLTHYLQQQGHTVHVLKRNSPDSRYNWNPDTGFIQLEKNIKLDAVINLSGVNIGDKRWSQKRKQDIIQSRVNCTELLADTIKKLETPPSIFINASAIGYYGDTGQTPKNEDDCAGSNYLTDIVTQWENAANTLKETSIRTVFIRSGVVLSNKGGALKKMLLPFKLGLGGNIGSGEHYMSWISLIDELRAIEFLLNNNIHGPVNLTSPYPVTNKVFTKALGQALKRPTLFPMPSLIVKLLFGEMGNLLLLGSSRITPNVLLKHGFKFSHPDINSALRNTI
jgi:uncharacterized protein (TIGR01777 family)